MGDGKILPELRSGRGTIERKFNGGGVASAASVARTPPPLSYAERSPSPSLRDTEDLLSYTRRNVHGRRMTMSTQEPKVRYSASSRPPRARTRRTVNIVNFRGVSR